MDAIGGVPIPFKLIFVTETERGMQRTFLVVGPECNHSLPIGLPGSERACSASGGGGCARKPAIGIEIVAEQTKRCPGTRQPLNVHVSAPKQSVVIFSEY